MRFNYSHFVCFQICSRCHPFVIKPSSNLSEWWNICKEAAAAHQETIRREKRRRTEDETFIRVIQILLFVSRCNVPKSILTRGGASEKLLKNMKSLGGLENRILWTNEQFKVIYQSEKKVFFDSRFGTGKTLLLQSKCLEVAKNNPLCQAYYIVMPAFFEEDYPTLRVMDTPKDLPTLIELEAQKFFALSKLENAKVVTWSDMANEFPRKTSVFDIFEKFIEKKGENSSFFVDEYHEGYAKRDKVTVSQLSSLVISSKTFCCLKFDIFNFMFVTSPSMGEGRG